MAQPQVSKRLRGQIPWSVPELELVADLFGMDVVELVQRAANNDAPHQLSGAGRLSRAWRDSNPQPSDPWSASIYRRWWIVFLEWFIGGLEDAPLASVVGIDTVARDSDTPQLSAAPERSRPATVSRLWTTIDNDPPEG